MGLGLGLGILVAHHTYILVVALTHAASHSVLREAAGDMARMRVHKTLRA